jgi:hypothetical protein
MSARSYKLGGALIATLLCALAGALYLVPTFAENPPPVIELPPPGPEAGADEVHQFCGACHAYPPADTFPRWAWRREVKQAYDFFHESKLQIDYPSLESVALYYESRAPLELPPLGRPQPAPPPPVAFERAGYRLPDQVPHSAVANIQLVHLFDRNRLDVLVCDMRSNRVLVLRPYETPPTWTILGSVKAPAHAEVVDLDGDGVLDVLVASLGSFTPTDDRVGSVVWLRGQRDGTFTPYVLLEEVGRVADVRAADFNGDGKLDLVVGVFGWRKTGEILYLENQTTDWSRPTFAPHVVDSRSGTIHVPVCDLNGDGRPDFVALVSQEHEQVVAFLNEGGGRFRRETIYAAPHPSYGSSGIQLVDLDGDGDLDVLYTNGDVMDPPALLKPYHGVQWLENRGTFPFVRHALAPLYGAHAAVAADLDGDGKTDIVAVSFLPAERFPRRADLRLDAMLWLRQVAPGKFEPYALETATCDHVTCAAGDLYGDGVIRLVVGNFCLSKSPSQPDALAIWSKPRK